jgi:hypothetical protein
MSLNLQIFRGNIYVANDTQAWILESLTNITRNFNYLRKERQFELALQLAVCNYIKN